MSEISDYTLYDQRNCNGVDPNVFFPSFNNKLDQQRAIKAAQAICSDCVIREECYQTALYRREEQGVWGGVDFSQKPWRKK